MSMILDVKACFKDHHIYNLTKTQNLKIDKIKERYSQKLKTLILKREFLDKEKSTALPIMAINNHLVAQKRQALM